MTGTLDIQGGDYEHVLALSEDSAETAGLAYRTANLVALSKQVLGGASFGAAEYSLANHIMLVANGDRRLSAIPVFPSRAFRNVSVFVRRDSPLRAVADLKGKRIGIAEFAMTTAVWTRGHLQDDHGLDWREIPWVTKPEQRFPLPADVSAERTDSDLETMLLAGEIDALMTGKPKDRLLPPDARKLRCIVADPAQVERDYFTATGLFPIMHTVVFHPDAMADASAPRRVFNAYVAARATAIRRRLSAAFLPGAERLWDDLGADATRYGLTDANRRAVQTLSRYLREQGFIAQEPDLDDLFVPGSADWTDA